MNKIFILLLIGISQIAMSQSARLKVWLDPISEQLIQQHGMELDHGQIKKGVYIINDFTAEERAWMQKAGIKFDVEIDDMENYYAERAAFEPVQERGGREACTNTEIESFETPDNFELGSMGGFFTYEEFLENLDDMVSEYPNLITAKAPIDTFNTFENRPIYWVKISDNPGSNEAEPEVLYTSIHHAREPQSLAQLIFYMWYLLENYDSSDEVKHLIDNTEMFFIPMINPDGYVYNQTTNPNGGGLWRKNRRDNLDNSFGVDLNRNYAYKWAYDEYGSSPSTGSQTYRGPAAASEPETQAVAWFCENHEFEFCLNYHSHGNYLIYPWGYIPSPLSPDSNYFIAVAQEMTAQNNYVYGTGYETVNYATNGVSDDWMYGEQNTKNKIFSMTPEVGNSGDGFWPIPGRIVPLSEENVRPNLLLSHFAGDYAKMIDNSPLTLLTNGGTIDIAVQRLGQGFNGNYTFGLEAVTANASISTSAATYSSMNILEEYTEGYTYSLDQGISVGDEIQFDMVAMFNGYEWRKRITKIYGEPTIALSHSANDTNDFNTSSWSATTEDFVSSPSSITDSPFGLYPNNTISEIEYERVIDMRQSITGYLTFSAQWQTEAEYDYCQILASPIDGNIWSPLCGLYTRDGSQNQDEGQPVWDGNRLDWVQERIDLNDYIGQRVKIKFRLVSDPFVTYDGFYFDDLEFHTVIDEDLEIPLDTGYVDSAVGIKDINAMEQNLTVFPNPAREAIWIHSNGKKPASAVLYTINGSMLNAPWNRYSGMLNVEALPAGTYVVEARYTSGIIRKPIVIVR